MKHCVVFQQASPNDPLFLTHLKLNEDGSIKTGWVVNGGWNYEVRKGEVLAKAGNMVMSRWPKTEDIVVPIDSYYNEHYNKVIEKARKKVFKD